MFPPPSPQESRDSLGDLVLHEGLYYLNSAEWAVSAVEMSAIAAKNAANAAFDFWTAKSQEIVERDKQKETDESGGWGWLWTWTRLNRMRAPEL